MTTTPSPGAITLPVIAIFNTTSAVEGAKIYEQNDRLLVSVGLGFDPARDALRAEQIVRALNTHDRLVIELRRLSADDGSRLGDVLRVERLLAEAEGPTEQKEKQG